MRRADNATEQLQSLQSALTDHSHEHDDCDSAKIFTAQLPTSVLHVHTYLSTKRKVSLIEPIKPYAKYQSPLLHI